MAKEKKIKNDELATEVAELKNLLMRTQADFENYRKRTQKEKEELGLYLNGNLILGLLPILDNFRLALRHLPKELESNEWVHGIWHIEKQLEGALASEGLSEMDAFGKKFDPHLHEAIEEVDSEAPEGEVVEVVNAGYELNGKIIRPAKVKVSAKSKKDVAEEINNQ
jgi:molecular chaperone GrpE